MGLYKPEELAKMEKKGFLPISMAAKKVNRHRVTVYELVWKGTIDSRKVGGIMYINLKQLKKHYGA